MSSLHPDEVETIRQFAASVTLPIAYSEGGFPEPIGSGTLLSVGERLFVISAAHVFDNCEKGHFYLPVSRLDAPPLQVGDARLTRAPSSNVDIAILELRDADVRQKVLGGWRAIDLHNIGKASPQGIYILSGYPSERLAIADQTLRCTVITAITERLGEPPKDLNDPLDDELDLFFVYEKTGRYSDGEQANSPELFGVSGGGIWELSGDPVKGLWTSQKAMRLIGVQVSAKHFAWFRAHRSWTILDALSHIDEEMRVAIRNLNGEASA